MHDAIADEFLTPLVVNSVQFAADGVRLFELRHQTGLTLPPFAPGAHIPVMTPAGLRRYSLCNDPHETERYEIAVKREPAGRGGSRSMVDEVRVGDILPVGVPRNEFELHPRAKRFLFIAGGIGVTPIISMMRYLKRTQAAPFRLLYLTRDEANAPFLDVLSTTDFAPITTVHYDYGEPARSYDLWPILEKPTNEHIYCCGPRGLMDAVRDMSGHWPIGAVHFESFGVDAATRSRDAPFDIVLARSGRTLHIPADRSILEVLRDAGVHVRSSCEAGSCGSCRTRLIAGDVEHRDFVLNDSERESQMMVCCSRARSGNLTLDV